MFTVRETVQESTGFSPTELVFGHTVRGPLKLLKEQLLSKQSSPTSVLDYVSSFSERLHLACETGKIYLASVQSKMKAHFDKKSVAHHFEVDVLVLLSVPGSALHAKFSGPSTVNKKKTE